VTHRPIVGIVATSVRGFDGFNDLPARDQAALLTVPMLLLYGVSVWYVSVPVGILALGALLLPATRTDARLWFLLACLQLAGVAVHWSTADNHKYLIGYWTLALTLAFSGPDPDEDLRRSARLLIGLAFAFALAWKLTSPDFLSGDFFRYTFLFDERLQTRAAALGLVPDDAVRLNQLARAALLDPTGALEQVNVATVPAISWLAGFVTAWTVITEGLIALLFLAPPRWRLTRWRDAALLVFIATAYGITPVLGFASSLSAMGFVQCEPARRGTRRAWLAMFISIQVFRIPWPALLSDSF